MNSSLKFDSLDAFEKIVSEQSEYCTKRGRMILIIKFFDTTLSVGFRIPLPFNTNGIIDCINNLKDKKELDMLVEYNLRHLNETISNIYDYFGIGCVIGCKEIKTMWGDDANQRSRIICASIIELIVGGFQFQSSNNGIEGYIFKDKIDYSVIGGIKECIFHEKISHTSHKSKITKIPSCSSCSLSSSPSNKLKKCSRCEGVRYCNQICQIADWSEHKKICVPCKM